MHPIIFAYLNLLMMCKVGPPLDFDTIEWFNTLAELPLSQR